MNMLVKTAIAGALALGATGAYALGIPATDSSDLVLVVQNTATPAGRSAESGCRLLLSEDFQDGFTRGGVTVTNPFSPSRHALLEALLATPLQ